MTETLRPIEDIERALWDVTKIPNSMDQKELKQTILGLIFLKYITLKFDTTYQKLKEENKGLEETKEPYVRRGIYFIPPEARWDHISENTTIGSDTTQHNLIKAVRLIKIENKELEDILPTFENEELDYFTLTIMINNLSYIKITDEYSNILTKIFENIIQKFIKIEGKESVDLYTPPTVTKTLVSLLQPTQGKIYDPCCGTASILIKAQEYSEKFTSDNKLLIYGQEVNPEMWKIAKMNLIMHEINADIGKEAQNTFLTDIFPELKADYILSTPPFNQKKWGLERIEERIKSVNDYRAIYDMKEEFSKDSRWIYDFPPKGNANFAWLQHMIYHLSPNGKIGIILPNGSLSSKTSERKIRQKIVEDDLIETIITLPKQLLYSTGIPVSLWIINKNKTHKKTTLFIDARELGTNITRFQKELTDEDIKLLQDTYNQYIGGTLKDKEDFCKISTLDDIKEQEYMLTPGRYIEFKPDEKYKIRKLEEICVDNTNKQNDVKRITKQIEELLEEF